MTATSAPRLDTAPATGADSAGRRLLTVLLRRFGIPVAETVTADGAESAVEAAWWLSFPVTLVAAGDRLTERPATTRCGLATPAQVRAAYRRLATSFGPAMAGVHIRRQPQRGAEVVVRVTREAAGARVWLLLGGPAGSLVGAQVSRLAPVTASDAMQMLDELRGGPVARRSASEPAALDLASLVRLLERVGQLAVAVPQVSELELNPVIVTRCGVAVAAVAGRFRQSRAELPTAQQKPLRKPRPRGLRSAS
jgi:hypothetical protein